MKLLACFTILTVVYVRVAQSEKGLCAAPCEAPEVCEPCTESEDGHQHHCCRYPDGVRHWGKWCCYRHCQYGQVCVKEECHLGSTCKWPWLVEPGETYEANSSAEAAAKEYLKRLQWNNSTAAAAAAAVAALTAEAELAAEETPLSEVDDQPNIQEVSSEATEDSAQQLPVVEQSSDQGEEQAAQVAPQAIGEASQMAPPQFGGQQDSRQVIQVAPQPSPSATDVSGVVGGSRLKEYPWSMFTIVTVYDEDGNVISETVVPPSEA